MVQSGVVSNDVFRLQFVNPIVKLQIVSNENKETDVTQNHRYVFELRVSTGAFEDDSLLSKESNSILASSFELLVSQVKQIQRKRMSDTTNVELDAVTTLTKVSDTKYTIEIKNNKAMALQAGIVKFQFGVKTSMNPQPVTHVVYAKVVLPVEVSQASVMGKTKKMGDKMGKQTLKASSGDKFKVSFTVQDLKKVPILPHQAHVRFTHVKTKTNFYFPMKVQPKNMQLALQIEINHSAQIFKYLSGDYAVHALIADTKFEKSFDWDLGTLELLLPNEPDAVDYPLYTKTLLHESDTTLKALPEIKHIMRQEDSRPSFIVSYIFTLLVIVPLFGFLFFLTKIQLQWKQPSAMGMIWAVCFLSSLGCILSLFVLFWYNLTMSTTMQYLSGLSFFTLFTGHKALKSSAVAGLAQKTKKE